MFGWCLVISLHTWFSDVSHKGPNKGCICWTWPRCLSNIPGLEKSKKKKFQVSTSWVMSQKYTKNELLRQTQNVWAQGVIASFCSGRSSSMQTEQFRSFAALFRLKSYITIDQEPWFLIYVLSLCYVMLCYVASCVQLHKNTPSVFIDCSSGLPVAKAATVRRKKSMELEASWSSHKFWALPMGFLRFDGNGIRCHTCSFPCEISIFSNKAPWQSVISESFNSSPTMLQRICLFVYRTSRSESIRIFQSAKTPVVRVSGRVKDPMPRELPTFFGLIPSKGADHVLVGTKHTNTNIHER